jgi:hypothetical protein
MLETYRRQNCERGPPTEAARGQSTNQKLAEQTRHATAVQMHESEKVKLTRGTELLRQSLAPYGQQG